ncbi:hypothetical protein LJC59_02040 [Desulfovibrio sp. OttesenSCG-928-A18]|nr:hypothetical protein [Desulfovibrio sp. OttesenSCG-928-A18]
MKKRLCILICLCLLGSLAGCAPRGAMRAGASGDFPESAPTSLPEGMRLGPRYISALNEPCYEVYANDGFSSGYRAYCRRESGWVLLPSMHMTMPDAIAAQ